jgi:methylmalonyl-CoA carboxyltransferase 12S subunit
MPRRRTRPAARGADRGVPRTFSTPYVAAGRRLVDDIIEPAETRKHLAQALEYLHTKRERRPPKKHGLIPL